MFYVLKHFKLRAEVILKRWGNEQSYKIAQDACAKLLTERLMQMGPTFVKLGQLLSTRGDILPIVFIAHLSKLQDDVPPFPGHIAIKTIEKELGKPIDHIYDYFDPIPFAAASLGQVHKAMLGGRKLAVKVQRLGLYDQIKEDLKHIKVFVRLSVWLDRGNDGVQRDWNGIYTQLSELLLSELDYYQEAENARRFLRMFVDDNTEWVKVPEVYTNMSSASVLTMELVEGVRMDNPGAIRAAGIDPKTISRRLIESYLMQFCRHGFYRKSLYYYPYLYHYHYHYYTRRPSICTTNASLSTLTMHSPPLLSFCFFHEIMLLLIIY